MPKRPFVYAVTLLLLPVFFLFAGIPPARADLLSSLRQDLSNLTSRLESAQKSKQQTQAKIKYLQSQADSLQNELADLNRRMKSTSDNIVQGQAQVARMNTSITALGVQIAANEAKQTQDQEEFNKILVGVYEDGPVSYVQVVFGARSFTDFLSRLKYMGDILSFERDVLTALLADHQALAAENQSLGLARQQQVNELARLSTLKQQQKNQTTQKNTLLSQVEAAKKKELADLNDENSAMQYIGLQIKKLQEKYKSLTGSVPTSGTWLWPVPGYHDITSGYGWRTIFGHQEFHKGIDIGAPDGTPIVASNSGVVLYAGPAEGFGQWIVIQHSDGLMSLYGDMYARGVWVHPGQTVQAGQEIGAVGANGNSTGPHLHFGIITGFNAQGYPNALNPLNYVHP